MPGLPSVPTETSTGVAETHVVRSAFGRWPLGRCSGRRLAMRT